MIFEYQVPPDLVYSQDETNAQYVSIPGEVFHLVKDRAISAFRDPENSDSNFSNFEESEDFQQFKRNILQQLHYR